MSAKSKIINNVRYITAKVVGKPVTISEALIRSDFLFDDVDGIDSMHNQAIFNAIQLMGPLPTIPDSIPEGSGGNHGEIQVTDQAKEIKHLKAHIKKLKKKAKPVITHHKAWMKSVSMKQRLAGKKKWKQKESSEDAQDEGRTSSVVLEEKESTQKGVSTKVEVSTVKPDEGTDKSKVSTDKPEVSTAKPKEVEVSTDKLDEGTAEPKDGTSDESTAPTTVFRDDETIVEFLVSMSQNKAKQKGVEIKDVEDSDRPRATSTRSVLTLKPLPKIDPKDKGKKVLEEEVESDVESDAESDGVDESKRKFDQLAKDEEIARKVQEDWEAEKEMKKLAKEEAIKAVLIQDFNDIQDRIEADRLLAARLQEEERGTFTHVRGKKHADLKNMNFEEIQVLYKKEEGLSEETPREEDTTKVPAEREVTKHGTKKIKSGHVKMIARKRPRPQPDDDSDDEHRKCLRIVTFESTIDSEIMETKSFVSKLHKECDEALLRNLTRRYRVILWGDLKINDITPQQKKMIKVISETINKNGRILDGDYMKLMKFAYYSLRMGQSSTC
ncbi:hypothetical protein Tco_0269875 [Tanacetum coccineum]